MLKDLLNKEKHMNISIIRKIALFIIFQLLFSLLTMPFIIFYGPFENLKSAVVGMSMNSLKYQFVARTFLSEKDIQNILKRGYAVDPMLKGEKVLKLKFGNVHSDRIEVYDISGSDFKGKLMVVFDPTRIEVGYTGKMPEAGETTSAIASRNKAVAAVNGGGFADSGWTGTGGTPMGFIIHNGRVVYNQLKYEKIKQDTAAFTEDGMLIVGLHSVEELKKYKVKEAISFGPPLIVNGKPTISKGDGGWGIAPRTAVGQRENGEVIFITIDGRSMKSFGATLKDVQDILLQYGAVNAVNLDGGSSTTMFFNGKVINDPSDILGERAIPSVFMVVPAAGEAGK